MNDLINRQAVIDSLETYAEMLRRVLDDTDIVGNERDKFAWGLGVIESLMSDMKELSSAEPDVPDINVGDMVSRQAVIDMVKGWNLNQHIMNEEDALDDVNVLPSAQPEQRYTEEELRVFKHGISLSLLSKRSSQHWRYDENTATEIKFLERLYEKVSANMRGGQNE